MVSPNPETLDPNHEPWPGGTQHQLSALGIGVARIEDRVTADIPSEEEVEEQDIPPGVLMIRVRKITYDTDDRVVEVTGNPFPTEQSYGSLRDWSAGHNADYFRDHPGLRRRRRLFAGDVRVRSGPTAPDRVVSPVARPGGRQDRTASRSVA
ncbi:UTRA domain-containing protein [Streptomyces sp. NPDC048196]|uniref:UTRA domain-containing protein n=1 Tax=Streptomyces sp. NPDC048196 TaxID=3154712 RepID=UPI0033C2C0BB